LSFNLIAIVSESSVWTGHLVENSILIFTILSQKRDVASSLQLVSV